MGDTYCHLKQASEVLLIALSTLMGVIFTVVEIFWKTFFWALRNPGKLLFAVLALWYISTTTFVKEVIPLPHL